MSKPTPGPWEVYVEDVPTPDAAKAELCKLIDGTPFFKPKLYMITAKTELGHLAPAITGCGNNSEANARLIAASPRMYAYIVKCAEKGDSDAAEIIASI